MYEVLIAAHAVAATAALLAACGGRRPAWFAAYYGGLVAMLVLLVAAIAADLAGRDIAQHLISGSLIVLGGVMVWHAERARRVRRTDTGRFVHHVGFTVVGLVDAFVVVTVFNAGVAGWLAALIGLAIALAGHVAIGRATVSVTASAVDDGCGGMERVAHEPGVAVAGVAVSPGGASG